MKHLCNATGWMAAALVLSVTTAKAEVKVVRSPLEIGSAIDIGQVVNGVNSAIKIDSPFAIKGMMIQRTGVYLNQMTTVNDRLIIKVGVGGLFYYAYPEIPTAPETRSIRFGPGVGQAQGLYKFGDVEKPSVQLQFGYFPYKYNPDTKNLGEYLFRDGAYPGYELTGGWQIINNALYMAQGLRINGNFLDGKLSTDLNVFLEHDIEPIYDISPGLVLTYKPSSVFDVGAGVAFAHLIPVNPSKLNKKNFFSYLNDTLYHYVTDQRLGDSTSLPYTYQGTKVMARASFNLGAILDNPFIGKEGLKLYAEAALLGVKNYPYFYTDRMARIPVLVGLNLPTFNFFDVFAVEMEYRKWDFPNSTENSARDNRTAVWRIPIVQILDTTGRPNGVADRLQTAADPHLYYPSLSQAEAARRAQAFIDSYDPVTNPQGGLGYSGYLVDPSQTVPNTRGNLKWTVYVKKQLVTGVNLYLQVASDNMRAIRYEDNTLDREILTQKPSQWYYLFRLEFGI